MCVYERMYTHMSKIEKQTILQEILMKITIKNQIDSRKDTIVGIHPASQKLQGPDNISPMKISRKMLQ